MSAPTFNKNIRKVQLPFSTDSEGIANPVYGFQRIFPEETGPTLRFTDETGTIIRLEEQAALNLFATEAAIRTLSTFDTDTLKDAAVRVDSIIEAEIGASFASDVFSTALNVAITAGAITLSGGLATPFVVGAAAVGFGGKLLGDLDSSGTDRDLLQGNV